MGEIAGTERPTTGRRPVSRPRFALWAVGIGLPLLVWSALVASDGTVPGWEQSIFRAINGAPDWLERPMWVVQLLGVLVVPVVFAVGAAALRRWRLAAGLALLAALKLVVEREVLKRLVERQRPGRNEVAPVLRDVPSAGLSYPSGHAIVAFGIATLLAPYLGRTGRIVAFTIATGVGVARIYLGAHNPLDVVGGAGAGLILGGLLTLLLGVRHRGQPT